MRFVDDKHPELQDIQFIYKNGTQPASLNQDGTEKEHTFLWTAAPQAISVLYLDYVGWEQGDQNFVLSEESLAVSIGDDRYRETGMLRRLFVENHQKGLIDHTPKVLKIHFRRGTTRPRAVSIQPNFLPSDCIEVYWRGGKLSQRADMRDLSKHIRYSLGLETSEPKPSPTAVTRVSTSCHDNFTFRLEDRLPEVIPSAPGNLSVDTLVATIKSICERSQSRTHLVNSLLCIPIEDAKKQFWGKIRELTKTIQITDQDFNEAVDRGGMPSKLPLPRSGDSLEYAMCIRDHPARLPKDHQLIWRVALAAYPPLAAETDPDLKAAARYLAWYWNHSIFWVKETWKFSIVEDLGQNKPYERALVFLLSWLELPLVLQTGNHGPGKFGLFELGRWFQEHPGY
jgi:hypothetical protein